MQNIYVRIALYILAPIFAASAAWLAGWGVIYNAEAQTLTIHLEAALGAVFAGAALAAGVFRRWGVK